MLPGTVARRIIKSDFPERLAMLRKQRALTQKALAAEVGVHFVHLRRYEAGGSQPTLEVLCKLARALRVSADLLLFGEESRGPADEFRVQFEALSALGPEERRVVRDVLDALLLKHDAKRWAAA